MSERPSFLQVAAWSLFQHYRDRTPPWIKLHGELTVDSAEFLALPDVARSHLSLIWVVASRRANKIPNDAKLIARAIQSSSPVNLDKLIAPGVPGFLEPWTPETASTSLAKRAVNTHGRRSANTNGHASTALAPPTENAHASASSPLASCYHDASAVLALARSREQSRGEQRRKADSTGGIVSAETAATAPLFSIGDLAADPDVLRFLSTWYPKGIASPERRHDVAEQILGTLNGGQPFRDGVVRAHADPDRAFARLAAKCAEVNATALQQPDSAIVVLLLKLSDTHEGNSPGVVQVEREQAEALSTRADLAAAEAWLADRPDLAIEINARLDALFDPTNPFADLMRTPARESQLLTAWRARPHEAAVGAGTP